MFLYVLVGGIEHEAGTSSHHVMSDCSAETFISSFFKQKCKSSFNL